MNSSNKFKFIWWASAGCASRATSEFFIGVGVDDLYNHVEGFINSITGPFTHIQGVPEGKEEWVTVVNVRNPYSLVVSSYLNILEDEKKQGLKLDFFDYLKNDYFNENSLSRDDPFFLNVWKRINREADYILHMETLEEDLRKLPFLPKDENNWNTGLYYIRKNRFKNKLLYGEYVGEFQKYQRFYTQEIADFVYGHMKEYFYKFGYDRNSWK